MPIAQQSPSLQCFADHRNTYAAQMPNLHNQKYADEVDDKSAEPDVTSLMPAPAAGVQYTIVTPGVNNAWVINDAANKYLWLIRTDDVAIALETGVSGRGMQRQKLTHTNLSGGQAAHRGGELWFKSATHIYLNGASSRYRDRLQDEAELQSASEGFVSCGYCVCTMQWSQEINRPRAAVRSGEIEWQGECQ